KRHVRSCKMQGSTLLLQPQPPPAAPAHVAAAPAPDEQPFEALDQPLPDQHMELDPPAGLPEPAAEGSPRLTEAQQDAMLAIFHVEDDNDMAGGEAYPPGDDMEPSENGYPADPDDPVNIYAEILSAYADVLEGGAADSPNRNRTSHCSHSLPLNCTGKHACIAATSR
ncbi:hypothetical protein Agub_g15821, partial [Astrephomene gubernaculifera]